jgi:uncharacterized protein (TIGR03083 family)
VLYGDRMTLSHDRYCAEIVAQTALLTPSLDGADLTTGVPTCPDWNTGQLLRHLGGAQRWAAEAVRTRTRDPLPDEFFRDLSPYTNEDPAVLGPWLTEGAADLAEVLRAAGPDVEVWTPTPKGKASFYARRFTHETVEHRADAMLALGAKYTLDEEVALDTVDEWLDLASLAFRAETHPWLPELLGPGRTLHFHATDSAPEAGAEWVVDLTGETITWRRAHEKCAAAIRGPLVDLLLVIYRRLPADTVEILGDAELFHGWLERVSFG